MTCFIALSPQGEVLCFHAPPAMARIDMTSPADEATQRAWKKARGTVYVLERAPSRCPACKSPFGDLDDEEITSPGFTAPPAPPAPPPAESIPSAEVLEDTQP